MVHENKHVYRFGPFRLNAGERLLFREGVGVSLSPKSLDLLLVLIEAVGRLKTREELIEALWPITIVGEHNLTVCLGGLRKALGDTGAVPHYIQTVRGHGYRFIAPVAVEEPLPAEADLQPTGSSPHRRRMRAGAGAVLLVLIVATGVLSWHFYARTSAAGEGPVPARSIAVLPFENLSADKANAYFASGVQETIFTKLVEIGDLRVVSRSSTRRYPSHPADLKKVARELGVAAVLEGSVQKAGNRVQINVQLINARTDDHIWGETYTRTLENVFEVENDVAARVAAALKAKLLPAEAARLAYSPTRDPQAYLLFLKANYYANQVSRRGSATDPVAMTARTIALYRRAIARDPRFALAYARLSLFEGYAWWYELDPTPQRIGASEQAAKQALALAPDLPEAHLAMGYADYYGRQDYAAALRQFERARQILPNDADVIAAIAFIHRRRGEWRQAFAGFHRAAALDRLNPRWPDETGITLLALRRYPQAVQAFDQALADEPDNFDVLIRKAWALFLAGEPQRARRTLARIPHGTDPQGLVCGLQFEAARLAREPDRMLSVLDAAPSWVLGSGIPGNVPKSLLQAEAWSLKGEDARARKLYENAYAGLQAAREKQPGNAGLWSALGLAEAGLGQKTAALRDARRATELFPVSRDILAGPFYLAVLAQVYLRVDEPERAVKLLGRLLAMPAGRVISVPLLKLDPTWDAVRHNPRFQALLKRYGNQTPTPATVAVSAGSTR